MTALISGVAALTFASLASLGLTTPAGASVPVATAVSQTPVSWTPNVSAGPTVGNESFCDATLFGGGNLSCQSEVYSSTYVNGEVVVSGAFTEACQPGPLPSLCKSGTQVKRDDIFAYKAGTGIIDPSFAPIVNSGPVWSVLASPSGKAVFVGGAFTTVDGATHKGLVELNVNPGVTTGATADGSVVTSFKASVSNFVKALVLSPNGTALYVGGQFTSVDSATKFADGASVDSLARLNAATGALDTTFAFTLGDPISGLPLKVEAMSLSPAGTELAFSGTALQVNGQARPRLAVVNTGTTLGGASSLSDWTAPILNNNCSAEHDYVRAIDFSPDGTFLVTADTGYVNDGSQAYSVCDAVARFNVNAGNTTTTGTSVDVSPAWINYAGGDSFYSVAIAGNVVYTGGHNRWINNYCGQDFLCGPNAVLAGGLSAFDANTGMALAWWHPETTRGDGTMYMTTFPAGTYDGTKSGLYIGTDVDNVAGAYHSENALFPVAPTTSSTPGGPIPSGMFNEEGGPSTGTPLCIDDAGNSSTSGAPIGQDTCTNSVEQDWSIEPGGTIQVDNGPTGGSTNLCLDTAGGATAEGTQLALNTCDGSATQQWTQETGNTLVNAGATTADASPMCLDDPGLSTSPGPLQIWVCNGGANQVWPLPVAQGPPAPPASGEIFSQNTQNNSQVPCLDNSSNSLTAGNKVQLWTCTGDTSQIWNLDNSVANPGDFTIQIGTSHCLDSASSTQTGTVAVILNPCTPGSPTPTQLWTVGSMGSNNYELVNVGATLLNSTPYCLDDNAGTTTNGTAMQLYSCNGGSNQSWRLPAV